MPQPVRVALMNDYEVVVSGLQKMLAPYADRVRVVELDSLLPVHSQVDVLLYDAFGRERVSGPVEQVIRDTDAKVVIYTWHLDPELVRGGAGQGRRRLPVEDASTRSTWSPPSRRCTPARSWSATPSPTVARKAEIRAGDWPGRDHGLSARESEVLCLIAQGLSNQEIADRAFLSINSVKTYIRSAYRKIGVERRTQAVLWATRNGLVPSKARLILGDP